MINTDKDYYIYHIRDAETTAGFGFDGYIGITHDPALRKEQHFRALKSGTHKNIRLQAAFDKAPNTFQFSVVSNGPKKTIEAKERLLVPNDNHYLNNQRGGGINRGLSQDQAIETLHATASKASEKSDSNKNADSKAKYNKGHESKASNKSKSESKGRASSTGAIASGLTAEAAFADLAATAGVITVAVASGLGVAYAVSNTVFKDGEELKIEEREARKAGRVGAYGGGAVGAGGIISAVCLGGEVGLGVVGASTGLTALGGAVGGAGLAGVAITVALPALAAVAIGGVFYGGYKLLKNTQFDKVDNKYSI